MLPRTVWIAIVCAVAGTHPVSGAPAGELWTAKVQPLLDLHCVKCHGPLERKSGLELDTPEAVLKGGDEGPAIVPGRPEESRLYQYLAADSDPHMPPKKQLSEGDRATIHAWITAMEPVAALAKPQEKAARDFANPTTAIDTLITEGWKQRGIEPASPISDQVWCRRVYLDLAGRIPTASELQEFLGSSAADKRSQLIERLLASPEYAVRMREVWDALLMGRVKRDRQEDRRKQNGWWEFLERAFRENRPWDATVREILAARPGETENRGASWFLYERRNEHQAIAEAVAPLVYGTRIDCAQCHDHPLAREIKQAHYWGLVAAFNRGKNVEGGSTVAESAIGGFVNFTNLRKESQPAHIVLLTGRTIDEAWPAADSKETDSDDNYVDPKEKVRVPKFSRRAAFAEAATRDNPLLARAFVNRTWALLLGRGLAHPADEMNARNAPSHPELLDWLAKDFAANNYDARRVMRGIILSQPYALGTGRTPPDAFASALERPLMAEQLARSWRVAAGLSPNDDAFRRAVTSAMPDVMPKEYNATFQQAQFLSYSPAMSGLLQSTPGSTMERMSGQSDLGERVQTAFRAVLAREPDAEEASQARAFIETAASTTTESSRDLLWALMTSAEFLAMP